MEQHPKGAGARTLLTSVFGPYARDDEFGSRGINPMELGLISRPATPLLGPFLLWTTLREERRLARGVTYEPQPILERFNWRPAASPSAPAGILDRASVGEPVAESR